VKLLFTQANAEQVPYLKGSKEWQSHIYSEIVVPTHPLMPRAIQTVRLLQLDVAVRDSRSPTGWVFGTFVYNCNARGDSPWKRMVPIGLMWGNDPGITVAMVRSGRKLQETVINSSDEVPFQHLGWAGRLTGPVDNPISSCLSCHSVSQWPPDLDSPLVPPRRTRDNRIIEPDSTEWMRWFRNIKAEEPFTSGSNQVSLGYSLQLMAGLQNFSEWQKAINNKGGAFNSRMTDIQITLGQKGGRFGVAFKHRFGISREGTPDDLREP
jgi:hypothetical protein